MEYCIAHDSTGNSPDDREWLLTNTLGDYASGTAGNCNTRRYHGLLAVQTVNGRFMLLSCLEDSLTLDGQDFSLSSRHHPQRLWPEGWRFLKHTVCSQDSVLFSFKLKDTKGHTFTLTRTHILCRSSSQIIIQYTLSADQPSDLTAAHLTIRPLLSSRDIHALRQASPIGNAVLTLPSHPYPGFQYSPDSTIPQLFMQIHGTEPHAFHEASDWYYSILYPVEHSRGYDWQEDLFMPGTFTAELHTGQTIWLYAGTAPLTEAPSALLHRQQKPRSHPFFKEELLEHLRREADRFLVHTQEQTLVPAGYHWFGPWGRDTFIALPGLTFASGRRQEAKNILRQTSKTVNQGLIPNLFAHGNGTASFNSADASLWYILAVHRFLLAFPEETPFVRKYCWPTVKNILHHFAAGTMSDERGKPLIHVDEEGLLHTGSARTQLTWMDALTDNGPVTPRQGCAVELNALWFNALCFAWEFALSFKETPPPETALISSLKKAFNRVFRPSKEMSAIMDGGLYDVWNPDTPQDTSIRPNQIFAVALPFSPLPKTVQQSVVTCVQKNLLTPFGLRTLAPSDPAYHAVCQGSQKKRDMAYHQGTVWPWLLGSYADAVIKTFGSRSVRNMLRTLTPLFSSHLQEAGLGCISEIFDGDAPHLAGGCIAQAWSCAEVLRMLLLVKKHNPQEWKSWLNSLHFSAAC